MDIETINGNNSTSYTPTQQLPQTTTKEYKSSNTNNNNNKEAIEAQLNELRKEFYQKDEAIDDILRKRTTIVDRKVF
jgi:hypothetical protein